MVNSTEIIVHSKTNFVLLFPKPLMGYANWYCKIVMWPIVGLRALAISGNVKKIFSRWIIRNLSIAQKGAGIDWSQEMLQKYDRGASKHVYDIVSGDESWIYAYEPESKQQSTVFQDEPNPTKVARARSTFKQMIACFFGKTGHVPIVPLEQRRTVNSEW